MAKTIMLAGTMSDVGKSVITAGLCRILRKKGCTVAPFKAQNMALNSFVTRDGYELGRAQAMQAFAAGIEPDVRMNPVLLKPTGHMSSQVIVMGEIRCEMGAAEYYEYKDELMSEVLAAYRSLSEEYDYIIIEGAGSVAEINLKDKDIVNLGLARAVNAPVCLVGDIDRGGVFAQLYGSVKLLEDDERSLIRGMIINKFRGDKKLLQPGLAMIEEKLSLPVLGVVPYTELKLEDEDSLSSRLSRHDAGEGIDIAVIGFPYISNFTDMNAFDRIQNASVRYVRRTQELGRPDLIILPGSKNTVEDMKWLKTSGPGTAICDLAGDIPIFGICGGFQMLGRSIEDENAPDNSCDGLGLLEYHTVIKKDKIRRRVSGELNAVDGFLSGLSGMAYKGYEIHMGRTFDVMGNDVTAGGDVLFKAKGSEVYGTYVHGIFDRSSVLETVMKAVCEKKGYVFDTPLEDQDVFMDRQFDMLADVLTGNLDMERIFGIMDGSVIRSETGD